MRFNSYKLVGGLLLTSLVVSCGGKGDDAKIKKYQKMAGGAQVVIGEASSDGYGGDVSAKVIYAGDKIFEVTLTGDKETPAVGGAALPKLQEAITAKGTLNGVDIVSGATYTSKGVFNAVNKAMGKEVAEKSSTSVQALSATGISQGLGVTSTARLGPGKDDTGTGVYSFNEVAAYVLFDDNGKILDLEVDHLEVATPNYDGEHMPDFTGFPEQSFNADTNHDEKVDSTLTQTSDSYLAEILKWKTKRERGSTYKLKSNSWDNEMDTFEQFFIGKTVAEIKDWFTSTADKNGRVDTVSGATMSLKDGHGDIIGAIEKAYENRRSFKADKVSKIGLALTSVGRLGPHKDSEGKSDYSFNTQFAGVAYDDAGKVVAMTSDIMEVSSANAPGSSPRLTGFPGQNFNVTGADGKVTSQVQTEDNFIAQISAWQTKRERGNSYKLKSGTWAEEMDRFEQHFTGMTNDDLEKFAASLDEKGKTDVVSGASISLRDAHADTIGAILNAWKYAKATDITVK